LCLRRPVIRPNQENRQDLDYLCGQLRRYHLGCQYQSENRLDLGCQFDPLRQYRRQNRWNQFDRVCPSFQ